MWTLPAHLWVSGREMGSAGMVEKAYSFTNEWFEQSRPVWDELIPRLGLRRILEIGSFEGRSTCYLIEKAARTNAVEIHCVDTWAGGIEHEAQGRFPQNMHDVEQRFHANTQLAIANASHPVELIVHKRESSVALAQLIAENMTEYFDLIYVDGSHQAPDVLGDAVLGFRLLKLHGVMIFDDYLWSEAAPEEQDLLRSPKIAIDAFTNIFARKVQLIHAPLMQIYLAKISR